MTYQYLKIIITNRNIYLFKINDINNDDNNNDLL